MSTLAPRLPPTISRRSGSALLRSCGSGRATTSGRTGLPTTAVRRLGAKAPGKAISTRLARRASSLLVMPAAAFCSCSSRGMPDSQAATPPGPEAKPPMPSTTSGRMVLSTLRACSTDLTIR
ncbi:hypothetical protein D3C78_1435170 [compost metagenome]